MKWLIGCSGFHYKEWKEFFYPKGLAQSKWFTYYSQHFNTVELNVTFYRFPQLSFLENWYDKSPDDFLFAVKVPRLITHYKKFVDTGSLLSDFYDTISKGLKEKLGPVLFQLPPGMQYSKEKLKVIIDSINPTFTNIVECRHASWWNQEVYDAFKKSNISFCSISYPGLPDEVISTTKTIYYRFHGVPKLYYSAYEQQFLKKIADAIKKSSVKTAYVYFNNTAGPGAIENAEFIKEYVDSIQLKKAKP